VKPIGWLIAAIFLAGVLVAGCIAVVNDEDAHGPVVLASHEYDRGDEYGGGDYENDYGNRGENSRGRDRGSFSPGPFDDSPVDIRDNCVSLDCGGRERGAEGRQR
jgi:hypothetical protein